jgi:hypothetical protein
LIGPAWKRKEERTRALVPAANRSLLMTHEAFAVRVEDEQDAAANDSAARKQLR